MDGSFEENNDTRVVVVEIEVAVEMDIKCVRTTPKCI